MDALIGDCLSHHEKIATTSSGAISKYNKERMSPRHLVGFIGDAFMLALAAPAAVAYAVADWWCYRGDMGREAAISLPIILAVVCVLVDVFVGALLFRTLDLKPFSRKDDLKMMARIIFGLGAVALQQFFLLLTMLTMFQ